MMKRPSETIQALCIEIDQVSQDVVSELRAKIVQDVEGGRFHLWEALCARVVLPTECSVTTEKPTTDEPVKQKIIQKMCQLLLEGGHQKKVDGMHWKGRLSWCREPLDYRKIFTVLGIAESAWCVRSRMIDAGWSGMVFYIEKCKQWEGSWSNFYEWMMDGKSMAAKMKSARSVRDFLDIAQEFSPKEVETEMANLQDREAVLAAMDAQLSQVVDKQVEWPWQAVCLAWGARQEEEEESETSSGMSNIAAVITKAMHAAEGHQHDVWPKSFSWCKTPEDYRRFLRALGIDDLMWEKRWTVRAHYHGLENAILGHTKCRCWNEFCEWLTEGRLTTSKILSPAKPQQFGAAKLELAAPNNEVGRILEMTQQLLGKDKLDLVLLSIEDKDAVLADMQQRLDSVAGTAQWPWEALCGAWGVKDPKEADNEEVRKLGVGRRRLSAIISKSIRKCDLLKSGKERGWQHTFSWCETPQDFHIFLQAIGSDESEWSVRGRMLNAGWFSLVEAIERDSRWESWEEFYEWLMGEQSFLRKANDCRSLDEFLNLALTCSEASTVEILSSMDAKDVVLQDMRSRLSFVNPEEVQWPWQAICMAWGSSQNEEGDGGQALLAQGRRKLVTHITKMLMQLEKGQYNKLRRRFSWCKSPEHFQSFLRSLGTDEYMWEASGRMAEVGFRGLVLAIEKIGRWESWQDFYEWMMGAESVVTRAKTARRVRAFLTVAEDMCGDGVQVLLGSLPHKDELLDDMDRRLLALPKLGIEWPWQAVCSAWGVRDTNEEEGSIALELGTDRRKIVALITKALHQVEGWRNNVWKKHFAWCKDPADYRSFLLSLGTHERMWEKKGRMQKNGWSTVVEAIEESRNQSWNEFHEWMTSGQSVVARIKECRSVTQFIEICRELTQDTCETLLGSLPNVEHILQHMERRLGTLSHEKIAWPWQAISIAWGGRDGSEEHDEGAAAIGDGCRKICALIADTCRLAEGVRSNLWQERYRWCRTPEDFRCFLRAVGTEEQIWERPGRMENAGLFAFVKAIEADQRWGSWDTFHEWLMEGEAISAQIRTCRTLNSFLQMTVKILDSGEVEALIGNLPNREDVIRDMEAKLSATTQNIVQWPWQAVCVAWGTLDESVPNGDIAAIADGRQKICAIICKALRKYRHTQRNTEKAWMEDILWCQAPADYRSLLIAIGTVEQTWQIRGRMCSAGLNSLVCDIEERAGMQWDDFYVWLMEGKATRSKLQLCRTVESFLNFARELMGNELDDLLDTFTDPISVQDDMQRKLDALPTHGIEWPWQALCVAWGQKDPDAESELATSFGSERSELAALLTRMLDAHDGQGRINKWPERLQWCKTPSDFRCFLRTLGTEEYDWALKGRMSMKGMDGVVATIEKERSQNWEDFYLWMMEGNAPMFLLRNCRSLQEFLDLSERIIPGKLAAIIAKMPQAESVLAYMDGKLSQVPHEGIQWPWQALSIAWGDVAESDQDAELPPAVREGVRTMSLSISQAIYAVEGRRYNGIWPDRFAWCETPDDFRHFLRMVGASEQLWAIKARMDKNGFVGLRVSIERDGRWKSWEEFYNFLREGQSIDLKLKTCITLQELLEYSGKMLTEEERRDMTQGILHFDEACSEMQRKLDELPEGLEWPWQALCSAFGTDALADEQVPEERLATREDQRRIAMLITKSLGKHYLVTSSARRGWAQRFAWCETPADFRLFFTGIGITRQQWSNPSRLGKHSRAGLVRSILEDGRWNSWEEFHDLWRARTQERDFANAEVFRIFSM